jgi:hypothetical protein
MTDHDDDALLAEAEEIARLNRQAIAQHERDTGCVLVAGALIRSHQHLAALVDLADRIADEHHLSRYEALRALGVYIDALASNEPEP